MPPAERVLICALSGRALAQAARAAGFAPIVLDAFGDLDTRAVAEAWGRVPVDRNWRLRKGALLAMARRLAPPPIPLVWGSGFESVAALLADLGAGRELLGNTPGQVAAIKNPTAFAATARMLGIAHPELQIGPPRRDRGWLCKRAGRSGGGHVRRAGQHVPLGRGWYWQRWAPGLPVSALVVGNGADARMLAIGRQLVAALPGRPFRFAGTLAPADISQEARARLEHAASQLARHYGLRGLVSVDALVAGDRVTVLEVNPRPGGSMDAYGAALGVNLFALHAAACRGSPLPEPAAAAQSAGSSIVHARRATSVPASFVWPQWAADRSPTGSVIPAGGPICTVLAEAATNGTVLSLLGARADLVRAMLAPACGGTAVRYDRRVTTSAQAVW